MNDLVIEKITSQINSARQNKEERPVIKAFFDEGTFTVSYVIHDPTTSQAAIIDSVMDYDPTSGRTSYSCAQLILDYVREENLTIQWILETHAHADHLSAAPWLQKNLGGKTAIGEKILNVQELFGKIFNISDQIKKNGADFNHLFTDGEPFTIGKLNATALHVPGHTPADMAYVIGDAAFIGDTLFMPDYGTARADFPGGDARQLYRSIRRVLSLPSETRLFMCHDYKTEGRDTYAWECTVAEQRAHNIHVHENVSEEDFVSLRTQRDATLELPRLIIPSVQVNVRAGHLPEPEENGVSYIKTPLNCL